MKLKTLIGLLMVLLAAQHLTYAQAAAVTPEMRAAAGRALQAKDWKQAEQLYATITEREPQNANAWYRLGAARAQLNQLEPARSALEKAVTLAPNPYFTYDLACVYARLNDKEKAFVTLDRAVTTGYRLVAHMKTDTDLASLRNEARFNEIMLKATPCATRPEAAQFDFWLGEWNVANPQGQNIGTNKITRVLGQCVVFEEFSEFLGGGGKSFNLFNAPKNRWEQTWVDDRGGVLHFAGAFKDGAMRLTGMSNNSEGKPVSHRMSYTPQADGRVRQLWESSTDEGKTWAVVFDGLYVRKQ
jgi:hypothetical protein